ncbi:MAG: response regulator [Methylococcales bacterium]
MNPKGNILLVDDDRLVLATLAHDLTRAGYGIDTAESVDEAMSFLQESHSLPALVILDVRMPGKSGLELAQWLSSTADIPFMLLSAYSNHEIVDLATKYGALGYLVKPIDTPQLLPSIEAAMARAKDIKSLRTIQQQLQTALDAQRDINVAVGITMEKYRQNRSGAFELLRKTARNQRLKLAELSGEIIKASEILLKLNNKN